MTGQPWRLIRNGPLPGDLNMALDQVLLEAVAAGRSRPVLRLYRWAEPTLSLGYGQRQAEAVNYAACRRHGVPVVRRSTGGRAVLHDRELTYAVIAPEGIEPFPGGIPETYRSIAAVLQQMLAAFGLTTCLAPGRTPPPAGGAAVRSACFTAPALAELLCEGHKLTGSAQKRQGGAFLQHGSVPLEFDLELLFSLLDGEGRLSPPDGAKLLGKKVGWVNRWAVPPQTVDHLEDEFVAAFGRCFPVCLLPDEPSAGEWNRARQLARERFAPLSGIAG